MSNLFQKFQGINFLEEAKSLSKSEIDQLLLLLNGMIDFLNSEKKAKNIGEALTNGTLPPTVASDAKLTANDIKFGMMRFGKRSGIAPNLIPKSKIHVLFREEKYTCSIPDYNANDTTKGRVSGLKLLFLNHPDIFKPGMICTGEYEGFKNELVIRV